MMRLRRASVIAALSVLASTATASAECAWVPWSDVMFMVRSEPTSSLYLIGASPTFQCRSAVRPSPAR